MATAMDKLNGMAAPVFAEALTECCKCRRWADTVAARRPFSTIQDLKIGASSIFLSLDTPEFMEAFSGHPRIGEAALQAKFGVASAEHSNHEQSDAKDAAQATIAELAHLNDVYFDKYGYIFIVCATGKTAEEMLAILKSRMENEAAEELQIAASEQNKITMLRIDKLVAALDDDEDSRL